MSMQVSSIVPSSPALRRRVVQPVRVTVVGLVPDLARHLRGEVRT